MAPFTARRFRAAAVAGALGTLLLGAAPATAAAAAAPTLTVTGLTATVKGYEVTATTSIKSSVATSVDKLGVCVRDLKNANVDFIKVQNKWVTTTGVSHTAKQTLPAGTYSYWTCAYDNGQWLDLNTARPFVVTAPTPAPATPAATTTAKPVLSSTGLTAAVKGYEVTATTIIKSSVATSVDKFGVCVRGANKTMFDFVKAQNKWVTTTGVSHTAKQTLPAGTYDYWTCAYDNGQWLTLDKTRPFVVTTPDPTVGTTAGTTPVTTMPKGDLPGWKQVFAEDFTTNAPAGTFGTAYKNRFSTYHGFPDSFKAGTYNRDILSVKDGKLDMHLHKKNGRPQVAAPAPIVTTPWAGQKYGKFTVRFKSDALPGYKTAWLLWPDSNDWNEGEIDFPEGGLNSTIWGFNHCVGNPMKNCSWADTQVKFSDWHTASIEWTPTRVTYLLDGQVVSNDTKNVPHTAMHWVLQTETASANPTITRDGHLQIDWVTVYTHSK
jgi:hypothetical protein